MNAQRPMSNRHKHYEQFFWIILWCCYKIVFYRIYSKWALLITELIITNYVAFFSSLRDESKTENRNISFLHSFLIVTCFWFRSVFFTLILIIIQYYFHSFFSFLFFLSLSLPKERKRKKKKIVENVISSWPSSLGMLIISYFAFRFIIFNWCHGRIFVLYKIIVKFE